MAFVTIHLGSATPHFFDIVRKHKSERTAQEFAEQQNAATRRRYPTAYQTYEAVEIDDEGRVYRNGAPALASDGYHMQAR